jgi:hypothetical protein
VCIVITSTLCAYMIAHAHCVIPLSQKASELDSDLRALVSLIFDKTMMQQTLKSMEVCRIA